MFAHLLLNSLSAFLFGYMAMALTSTTRASQKVTIFVGVIVSVIAFLANPASQII